MLQVIQQDFDCSIYKVEEKNCVHTFFISTPESRHICSDLSFVGENLQNGLKQSLARTISQLKFNHLFLEDQKNTTLLLPSSAAFGFPIRDAIQDSLGWGKYATKFHIDQIESFNEQLWIVDQGWNEESLNRWAEPLISSQEQKVQDLKKITIFTLGSQQYLEALYQWAESWQKTHKSPLEIQIFFFEGIFILQKENATKQMSMSKSDANLAPEYIDGHYYNTLYPIQREAVGSIEERVFDPLKHLHREKEYWENTQKHIEDGLTYQQLASEKIPFIDAEAFGEVSLLAEVEKALHQLR
ncbi:hypothetical protein K4L44_08220 [Halosquirtibacter laminarini]|uniref:Uncharacterized protein n=1 Tax=Halosquirtibacter laminarini TaxID=3374600 RepID=A0AC61NJB1_9BACT|nr:hypothetical protein K4L44_08220 [Prolixibacteraceae bacterium]